MKRVSRQNFIRYTSRYLNVEDLPIIITNRGEDELYLMEMPRPFVGHDYTDMKTTIFWDKTVKMANQEKLPKKRRKKK